MSPEGYVHIIDFVKEELRDQEICADRHCDEGLMLLGKI
jgi:hypothetical protein